MPETDFEKLSNISASQWGLVTTAQAEQVGVGRLKLSRLVERGLITRLVHGVYRDAGAAESDFETVKAVWLSTNPKMLAETRLSSPDVIVGGTTATVMWSCGDLEPYPYQFYSQARRQTQREELTFIKRNYTDNDFAIIDGMPVARIEFVIADLLSRKYDYSLISDIFKDARRWLNMEGDATKELDLEYLSELLNPIAGRYGSASGDEFASRMLEDIGEGTRDYQVLSAGILAKFCHPLTAPGDALEYNMVALGDGTPQAIRQAMGASQDIDVTPLMKNLQAGIGVETLKKVNSVFAEQMKGILSDIDTRHFYGSIPKIDSGVIASAVASSMPKIDPEALKGAMNTIKNLQGEEDE